MEASEPLSQYKATLQAAQLNRRPLVDQASNKWQTEKDYQSNSASDDDTRDFDEEGSCAEATQRLIASRRFRRMIAVALLVFAAACYIWVRVVQPRLDEEWAYKEGFVSQASGTYGIAKGGDTDMVRIKDLDKSLLPGGQADPEGKRRLVFVGDVHGCKEELTKLLLKAKFDEERDHLILTGDVLSKGPDNIGVLDELIRLKASSVRGNHEDRILHIANSLVDDVPPPSERSTSKGFAKDAALLKQMKPHHIKYLRDMPLMLHIATLPQALPSITSANSPINQHILVVHAGLVPGVSLQRQDPYFVMNMRSINRRTHVPSAVRSESRNSKPWFEVWGWYNERISRHQWVGDLDAVAEFNDQDLVAESDNSSWRYMLWKIFFGSHTLRPRPQVVIYGHDSKAGLQIKRFSKGLDSGCVGGGQLTAVVLDARGRTEMFHVGCKNWRE